MVITDVDEKAERDAKSRNILTLWDINNNQVETDEDYVSGKVIDNALRIMFYLFYQPEIFKTCDNSIHMQYETEDRSYLEFEVFENRVTCMIVPHREYDSAVFPEVSLDDIDQMNKVVGEFYGFK